MSLNSDISLIEEVAVTKLPTIYGEFKLHAFKAISDNTEQLALTVGDLKNIPLIRVHSECLTGDALFSLRCDCGAQLQKALGNIQESGNGALIYVRNHEGRGIGLLNKIKAYQLQDGGLDTVEANHHIGFKTDLRQYDIAAHILKYLDVTSLRLLTNNPEKVIGLTNNGLKVVERVPLTIIENDHNKSYLDTKRRKMGHIIPQKT